MLIDVLWIAARGFCQVGPVAANTVYLARGEYHVAAMLSGMISVIWWANASSAHRREGWGWAVVYGVGAALGTSVGAWLALALR